MTHATERTPRLAVLPAALIGALLLAGCSTGNIGDSWQCPLAEGGSCDSVAAADPAVPDPGAARKTALAEPLWRVRETGRPEAPASATPCETECDGGFDPFAWLAGLFGGGDDGEGHAGPLAEEREPAAADIAPETAAPATAALPAEAGPSRDEPAGGDPVADDPDAGDLRSGEVVARIWIAPFVDADGVYREASHVRVVLEPAGWRVE